MVSYSTTDFKPGLKILIDSEPCEILEEDFVKPGKGQAFSKVKFRNLLTNRVGEKTCKIGESLEAADVTEMDMQYLYSEGATWYFMHTETFEQIMIDGNIIEPIKAWLTEEDVCKVCLWNGSPLSVIAPIFVDLKIAQTDPGVRGDTATGGTKPAILSTGAVVKVPLFIDNDELIKIDTRNGQYVSRAKD